MMVRKKCLEKCQPLIKYPIIREILGATPSEEIEQR